MKKCNRVVVVNVATAATTTKGVILKNFMVLVYQKNINLLKGVSYV